MDYNQPVMNYPPEMPESEVVRARKASAALADGVTPLGLHPKTAELGLDEYGQTCIVMNFGFREASHG